MHYWTAGRGARFAVEDKMVLGHEGAGEIIEVGAKVENVTVGDRVAFEPGFATQEDDLTKNGRYNLSKVFFCATPPDDGCLCEYFVHKASCCYVMPQDMSYELGAMIEPLSVGIHAAKRARVEPGQKVLITGAGPIGLVRYKILQKVTKQSYSKRPIRIFVLALLQHSPEEQEK